MADSDPRGSSVSAGFTTTRLEQRRAEEAAEKARAAGPPVVTTTRARIVGAALAQHLQERYDYWFGPITVQKPL